mmetsp:Transcript_18041/g.50492  ORF Transcript_18041/g.50492 Transcript_18041/m.50492 type:complete len:266 (-) Transcript_18041:1400-2197(-)
MWGASSDSHSGSMAVTSCISKPPEAVSWTMVYTTQLGRQRKRQEDGWMVSCMGGPRPVFRTSWKRGRPGSVKPCAFVLTSQAALKKYPAQTARRSGTVSGEQDTIRMPSRCIVFWICSLMSAARNIALWSTRFLLDHSRLRLCISQAFTTLMYVTRSPSATANRRLASSSSRPVPDSQTLLTDKQEATTTISMLQPSSADTRRLLASIGSTGSSAIASPKGEDSLALSSRAPNACRSSKARTTASAGGGASHSNLWRLSMPRTLS